MVTFVPRDPNGPIAVRQQRRRVTAVHLGDARSFTVTLWRADDSVIERLAFLGTVDEVHDFAIDRLSSVPDSERVSIIGHLNSVAG